MHPKTRFERRKKDFSKALRKKKISDNWFYLPWEVENNIHYYNNLHEYSKNKIHCSCPMCRAKTRGRGRYGTRYNPSVSDLRKMNLNSCRKSNKKIDNNIIVEDFSDDV